ncbi:hypothetical protein ACVBEQ_12490 [Nakamurella sp. GG22]
MTAAADRRRVALCAAMLAVSAVLSTGCTGGGSAPTTAVAPAVPVGDLDAIRTTVDRLNRSAAGAVAEQQDVLASVVDPGSAAALDKCPTATSTLRFEPVYPALRPAPEWAPTDGTLAGTVYALPSLIRIYTGDRVTGTDLTTLHLGVHDGEALLTAVCVG